MSKQKLKLLILLNLTWSLIGFYADFAWLSVIPTYLIPFTAICSLYPPLLLIWYSLRYFGRKIPAWYTFWLVLGTSSYGLIAQFYFPLLMSWKGINFHDVGSMFWVAVYGLQSLVLIRHLKIPTWFSVLPGLFFLLVADFTHYFALTFVDFIMPGYPLWMKNLLGIVALTIQLSLATFLYFQKRTIAEQQPALEQVLD